MTYHRKKCEPIYETLLCTIEKVLTATHGRGEI